MLLLQQLAKSQNTDEKVVIAKGNCVYPKRVPEVPDPRSVARIYSNPSMRCAMQRRVTG